MHLSSSLYFFFLTLSLSSPTTRPVTPKISLIHAFLPNASLENLAVRPNNQVLVTLLNAPLLYLVSPVSPSHPTLVHNFSPATALTGITESAATPDIYYVAAGTYDAATRAYTNGSFNIWEVDLTRSPHSYQPQTAKPRVRKVAHLASSGLPNGLTALSSRYILVADSPLGAVFRVDIRTGQSKIVIQDPTMAPTPIAPFGINGLRVHEGYLYYTNSDTNALARIPIDLKTGKANGKKEVLSTAFNLPDDFEIGRDGKVYVAENAGNATSVFDIRTGKRTVLADRGSSGALTVGSTSIRLGRGKDRKELFVTTSGGEGSTGGPPSSGKLLRLEL